MSSKDLKKYERVLKWEKKEVDKRVNALLLKKAEPIAEAMANSAVEGNFQSQQYILDKLFGKARQNIGLDGGSEGSPIIFMPSTLVQKFALDKPIESQLPDGVEIISAQKDD